MKRSLALAVVWSIFGLCRAAVGQDASEIRIDKSKFSGSPLVITEVVHGVDAQDIWQTGPFCGANCLYVLLSLKDLAIPHSRVKQLVPTTNDGATLLDLKNAARRLGLDCEIAEVAPETFGQVPLPFIALLGVRKNQQVKGHYVVVYDLADDHIMAVDGTTGHKERYARSVFNKSYSGYLLFPREGKVLGESGSGGSRTVAVNSILVVANILIFSYQVTMLRSRRQR